MTHDIAREQGRLLGYRFRLAELESMLLESIEIGLHEVSTNDSAYALVEDGLAAFRDGDMDTALTLMIAAKDKLNG